MEALRRLFSRSCIPNFPALQITRATSLMDMKDKPEKDIEDSASDLSKPAVNDSARASPTSSGKTPFSYASNGGNGGASIWRMRAFTRREQLMLLVTLLCIGQVSFMQKASFTGGGNSRDYYDPANENGRPLDGKEPGEPEWKPATLPTMEILPESLDKCAEALKIPKVALMFLTTGDLYHEQAWKVWFQSVEKLVPTPTLGENICNGEFGEPELDTAEDECMLGRNYSNAIARQHLYSVYIHAPPTFRGYRSHSLWRGQLIRHRITTSWGAHNLVEATRLLLWEAFRDPANQRFVLMSESDIPLYDPLTFYRQIMSEQVSRLDTCKHSNTNPWRFSPKMETSRFKFHHWRKSPQWFTMIRPHVELALKDEEVYRKFERHCWSAWDDNNGRWHRDCFSDEHYFATLLAVEGKEEEGVCESRGVAFTDWSENAAHPASYHHGQVKPELIKHQREAMKSFLGSQFPDCDWEPAEKEAKTSFMHIADAVKMDTSKFCSAFWKQGSKFANAMPATCTLTARKYVKESSSDVLKMFRDCGKGGVQLVAESMCERHEPLINRASSWFTSSFTG